MTTELITPGQSTTWSFGTQAPPELVDTTILAVLNEVSELLALTQRPEDSSLGSERITRAAAIVAANECRKWGALIGQQRDHKYKAVGAAWTHSAPLLINAVNAFDREQSSQSAARMAQHVVAWLTTTHNMMYAGDPFTLHRLLQECLAQE